MSEYPLNPYYDADKLGIEIISFDEPDMSYEYNTLLFVRPRGEKGLVYSVADSGCSCPIPFEEYVGENQKEVLEKLDRVKDLQSARDIFVAWNLDYDKKPLISISEFEESGLKEWF